MAHFVLHSLRSCKTITEKVKKYVNEKSRHIDENIRDACLYALWWWKILWKSWQIMYIKTSPISFEYNQTNNDKYWAKSKCFLFLPFAFVPLLYFMLQICISSNIEQNLWNSESRAFGTSLSLTGRIICYRVRKSFKSVEISQGRVWDSLLSQSGIIFRRLEGERHQI